MTIKATVVGGDPLAAANAVASLLETASGEAPAQEARGPDGERRDLAASLAIASLILSVPGAISAALDVADKLKRRRDLARKVEEAKAALAAHGSDATLEASEQAIDLRRTATDEVVDLIIHDLGG